MATITTDTYLDAAARTAGEAWTLNGGTLIVRTDTRWHAGSPASMTGTLGVLTQGATYNGGYFIDAQNVRWMPFSSGSGNVPAIGTSITQGAVSGYLLGVWASLTAAPTAVGAAMPATGFIKFREVTGGAYSAGALTGIAASADSPDVTGWIEVVHDQSVNHTFYQQGLGFKVRGGWFQVGVTTGIPGQQIQIPTNGGGTGTWGLGLFIGDPNSDGEWYPACISTTGWSATYMGTDARSKFVEALAGGIMRIGHNGTVNVGYTPPAGLPIYIPSVIGRQCTTAARASNVIPSATMATRPEFYTLYQTTFDVENFMGDWFFNLSSVNTVRMVNVCFANRIYIVSTLNTVFLQNCCNGVLTAQDVVYVCQITQCFGLLYIERCAFCVGTAAYALHITSTFKKGFGNNVVKNCRLQTQYLSRNTSYYSLYLDSVINTKFENIRCSGAGVYIVKCFDLELKTIDYCDTCIGGTSTSTSPTFLTVLGTGNILIDGISFGLFFTIANCHPYQAIIQTGGCFGGNVKIRNLGLPNAVYDSTTNAPNYLYYGSGGDVDVEVSRLFISTCRSGLIEHVGSSSLNFTAMNLRASGGTAVSLKARLSTYKGNRGTSLGTAGVSMCAGSFVNDLFTSDTTGLLQFIFYQGLEETQDFVSLTGNATISYNGGVKLCTVGDSAMYEMPYFLLGYTAFANTAVALTGTNTGNLTYQYQIDRGSGWNGTWKTLNNTNLYAETNGNLFSPIGFKLKLLITCITGSTTNLITSIIISTATTLQAQIDGLYPLSSFNTSQTSPSLTLFNLVEGSSVTIFKANDSSVLSFIGSSYNLYEYEYEWEQNINTTIEIACTGYQTLTLMNVILTDQSMMVPINQIEV